MTSSHSLKLRGIRLPTGCWTSALAFVLGMAFFLGTNSASVQAQSASEGEHPKTSIDQAKASTAGALRRLEQGVRKFELSNGLRVILFRRGAAPVFSGQTWVKVGGVDETLGKTGAAHLLEHMAFKGTETIGTKDYAQEKLLLDKLETLFDKQELIERGASGFETVAQKESGKKELKKKMDETYAELQKLWVDNEFSIIYERQGENGLNAATAKDYTMYRVSLPKVAFELWCSMESERLLRPVFRQFYKERDVVHEERRMRTDDDPGGRLYEALISTAYWSHPYKFPTVGWPKDIVSLRRGDTEEMYRTYYRPDNMVISIVGDIDPDKAIVLLEKYFGRIPRGDKPTPRVMAEEVPQKGEREVTVEFDAQPSLFLGYHKPTYPHPDDLKFAVLHAFLTGGRSSLFHREIVIKRQLATGLATDEAPGDQFPSLFIIAATPRAHVTNDQLADAVQQLLDGLMDKKISEQELASAKRRVRTGFLSDLDSNEDLAATLAESELLFGGWKARFKMFDMIEATTAEDISRLVREYLRPSNRTYAHLERPKK